MTSKYLTKNLAYDNVHPGGMDDMTMVTIEIGMAAVTALLTVLLLIFCFIALT